LEWTITHAVTTASAFRLAAAARNVDNPSPTFVADTFGTESGAAFAAFSIRLIAAFASCANRC
jgi:hypothetical protein